VGLASADYWRASRLFKYCVEIALAVQNMHDLNVVFPNAIENQILADRKAAVSGAKLFAPAADSRALCDQVEVLCDCLDESIRNFDAALDGDIFPDGIEFGTCWE
jgi:hypothetical protein